MTVGCLWATRARGGVLVGDPARGRVLEVDQYPRLCSLRVGVDEKSASRKNKSLVPVGWNKRFHYVDLLCGYGTIEGVLSLCGGG
jgi:hypothetical protein